MKSAIALAGVVVSMMASLPGLAADEHAAKRAAAAKITATHTTATTSDQPPELSVPEPVVSAPTAPPLLALPAAAPSALITLKQRPETHRFFDIKNSFALGAAATSLTADAVSTQQGLAYPGFYEVNPVARPFVKTRAGAAAYSAGSLGLLGSAMYLAHRTHHHRLERILPFALAGWEGLLAARNYRAIANRAR